MSGAAPRQPAVLVIIDGYGHNDDRFGNAIAAAETPVMDRLGRDCPHTLLAASGEAVGLPEGQQGNSEVGHLTIGAGRVVYQALTRISRDIRLGTFFDNAALVHAVDRARERGTSLHLIGLLSPGGVHSHMDHALAVVELAQRRGLDRVLVHAITDGRDEPPSSAAGFLRTFEDGLRRIGAGRIASVSGRYYTMDRDRRWDRTRRAYELLCGGGEVVAEAPDTEGGRRDDAVRYVEECYARGVTDEFVEPAAILDAQGEAVHIGEGDSVVFFNFRPDRARQLATALSVDGFDDFPRLRRPRDLCVVTFTEYERGLPVEVAFPKEDVRQTLAEVVSDAGLRQFHVAETEKYAHVTYFVNGGREEPFPGEERVLIPSPKVAELFREGEPQTYDQTPAMSAEAIAVAVVDRLRDGGDALVVLNFANPDMVGHTGVFDATVRAVEVVDACIGRIVEAASARGAAVVITADHGNAEYKIDRRDGSPLTAHTTSPVPLLVCGAAGVTGLRDGGGLADVAPTVLGVLGLAQPQAMTGDDRAVR